ncbi:DUF4123 domain-containing protein [Duganella violaceipulchra]|uniref:DUF4123 domain-containing protein n=1 Tax=Duganella violaceipulchra TaxID=2849652 RepID=A0AA41HJC8_9BURK|nr:DUF4123 domain-containing protein [Duganella violaceicalia]MBV6325236.1 DUF4123 domain-containing protein [Duganella violaceicalia]MCP2012450.1 hypothetical protein [Duganella violaceicalia]
MVSTYILIDTTLIGYPKDKPWTRKPRKLSWLAAFYERDAITVSPILIDIERASFCNRLDAVMMMVNAMRPQLGISFIETELTLPELQEHLRQFIYVKTEDNMELTLRFADCAVLAALSVSLTGEQWSAIVAPFERWKIHGRDGKLKSLPILKSDTPLATPLLLSDGQIASLKSAMSVDQLLANLRKMRPAQSYDYSTLKSYEYAEQARQIWFSVGHKEDTDLLLFARDVFDTDGKLLLQPSLTKVLEQPDPVLRRKELHRMASLYPRGG